MSDTSQGAVPTASEDRPPTTLGTPTIIPASPPPMFRSQTPLTLLICDHKVIRRLLETLLEESGLSINEISRRMGSNPNNLRQYLKGRRSKPSLQWFIRYAELCGARINLEMPEDLR